MNIDDELPDIDYDVPTEEIHGGHGAAALERANWHLRHIAAIERRQTVDEQVYATERARIDRWREQRMARWASMLDWHTKPCVDLLAAIRASDPRTKTLDLPAGKIKSRVSTTPRIVIDDQEALYAWAVTTRPDLIRPSPRVLAGDLRDRCDVVITADAQKVIDPDTGEVVPGVSVVIPEPMYSIDTSSDEL